MPNMVVREMPYTPEVTGVSVQIRFKIRQDYADTLPAYAVPTSNTCGGSAGFKPRAIVVDFEDGSSIRFPVQLRSGVRTTLATLFALPGAVCAHLDGEKWINVPGVGNAAVPGYATSGGFAQKIAGVMVYESDVTGGDVQAKVAIEVSPFQLSDIAVACAQTRNTIDEDAVCSNVSQGFKPRGYYMIAKNLATGGSLRRKAPVAAAGSIIDCKTDAGAVAPCVAYTGESVRNAHLYIPTAPTTP